MQVSSRLELGMNDDDDDDDDDDEDDDVCAVTTGSLIPGLY